MTATDARTDITPVSIGQHLVGDGQPVYVIGEIGLNHNGDVDIARRLIDVAADAGAQAVKFQKRTPEISTPVDMRDKIRQTPWGEMTYLDYRYRVEFDREQYQKIAAARRRAWAAVVRLAVGRAVRRVPRGPRRRRRTRSPRPR